MEQKELRAQIRAEHGEVVFATLPRVGLIAVGKVTQKQYLPFADAVLSRGESTTTAKEQLVIDALRYPSNKGDRRKVRDVLRLMPGLAIQLSGAIEALTAGDFTDRPEIEPEKVAELDSKHDLGWKGISVDGIGTIILATNETAGSLARVAIDALREDQDGLAEKIQSAILAFVSEPSREVVETLLEDRSPLLFTLWRHCQELAGIGALELGKD